MIRRSTPGNGDGQPSTLSHESDYRRSGSTDSWGSRRWACRQLDGRVTGFESACLLAFGLAAFLAGLVLAGQAIARLVAASAAELRLATALGLTRAQGTAVAAAGPVAAAVAGASAGVALAIVASRWMPFGVAAAKEPDPGVTADWLVLGAAAQAGLPVPTVVGVRFAPEPGRGANAVPARAALPGAVSGVLGVIAAFTFAAGVSDAAAHPARFGQDYQLAAVFGSDGHDFRPNGPVLRALATDPAVAGLTDIRIAAASSGATPVLAHSYTPVGAPVPLVLMAGVPPSRAGTRRMRVTGIGFTMESTTSPYDNGGWVTGAAYTALFSGFKEHGGLIALRPGASPADVLPRRGY